MSHKPSFAAHDHNQILKAKHRQAFLAPLDHALVWAQLEGQISPLYPKAGRGHLLPLVCDAAVAHRAGGAQTLRLG